MTRQAFLFCQSKGKTRFRLRWATPDISATRVSFRHEFKTSHSYGHKNMVDFGGRNFSLTLGQSAQLCDKTDYKATPPFWSADFLPRWNGNSYNGVPSHFLIKTFHIIIQHVVMTEQDNGAPLDLVYVAHWTFSWWRCCAGLSCHVASVWSCVPWGTSYCFVASTVKWGNFFRKMTPMCLLSFKN